MGDATSIMDNNNLTQINRKKILVLALIVIGLILVTIFGLRANKNSTVSKPTEKSEVKTVGIVIIDNTTELSSILLSEQYSATYNALSSYIHEHVSADVEHATITNKPTIAEDGTVRFTVKTDKPEKVFDVFIERNETDSIVLKIPSDNFSQKIQVFGTGDTGD